MTSLFTGIVVTDDLESASDSISNYVFVLTAPKRHNTIVRQIVGVHYNSFDVKKLPNQDLYRDDVACAKNKQRHLDKPLLFGDNIEWTESDIILGEGIIINFERIKKLYESRMLEGKQQLLIGGIVKPLNTYFWNDLFPTTFDSNLLQYVEPDVWVKAWYNVKVVCSEDSMSYEMDVSIDSFDDYLIADQHNISRAPWNEEEGKFKSLPEFVAPAYDDEDIDFEEPEAMIPDQKDWRHLLLKHIGLVVDKRRIASFDLPEYDFVMPVVQPLYKMPSTDPKVTSVPKFPERGEYVVFDAEWSTFHKKFFVSNVKLHPELVPHPKTGDADILVRIEMTPLHGLYREVKGTLGYVDDPFELLALWPLFKGQGSLSAGVRCSPTSESKVTRFRVHSLPQLTTEDKKFYRFTTSELIEVTATGFVVDDKGTISVPIYPGLKFRYNEPRLPAIGAIFKFRAHRQPGSGNNFDVLEVMPIQGTVFEKTVERYMVQDSHIQNTLFLINAHLEREGLLYNEKFGLIDPKNIIKGQLQRNKDYKVWVMVAAKPSGSIRSSRVFFEVVAEGTRPPSGHKPREDARFSSVSSSQMSEASLLSQGSNLSRFSVPSSVRSVESVKMDTKPVHAQIAEPSIKDRFKSQVESIIQRQDQFSPNAGRNPNSERTPPQMRESGDARGWNRHNPAYQYESPVRNDFSQSSLVSEVFIPRRETYGKNVPFFENTNARARRDGDFTNNSSALPSSASISTRFMQLSVRDHQLSSQTTPSRSDFSTRNVSGYDHRSTSQTPGEVARKARYARDVSEEIMQQAREIYSKTENFEQMYYEAAELHTRRCEPNPINRECVRHCIFADLIRALCSIDENFLHGQQNPYRADVMKVLGNVNKIRM